MDRPIPDHDVQDRIARLSARVEREKAARREAERMLETRSLELHRSNEALRELANDLEAEVESRTALLRDALTRARTASASKSRFLAMMSHEMRTPLIGVLGMAELLAGTELDPTQAAHVSTIRTSGESLLVLIDDVLDLSRLDAGRLELDLGDVDLAAEIRTVVDVHAAAASAKGLAVHVDVDRAVGVVTLDARRLRQVLTHLLSNAVKFTDRGAVAVRARTIGSGDVVDLVVEVADTGIGIAAEDLARVLDVFSQADGSMTRRYGGTGIGLALCSRLAQLMKGTLEIDSTPGSGTRVFVRLPVRRAQSAIVAPERLPDMRVLVAEDNAVNQQLVIAMLKVLGIEPDVVGDGEQAVERARADRYDVVLMDLQMPIMDGLDATRTLRRLDLEPQPRIIALTANSFESDRDRCRAAGMDGFVAKPFGVADLRAALALAV